MDFKLILLLLGLGQLVVVVLYALWGGLAGLKRELKCTAVVLILLLLGWLIFSDPAMMMGIKIPGALLSLLSSLGVDGQTATVWEVILQVLHNIVPNGAKLFVEGREAYELAYNVIAGALRGVGLMVITCLMLYLAGLIRLISHFVNLIVKLVKKIKAKKAPKVETEEVEALEEPEQVVLLQGLEGADDVIVVTDENELPAPKRATQHIWGAVVGLVKAVVIIMITFVPLSGVVSILDETSEETRGLLSDLVSGDVQLVEGESSNVVDIVFDFVEDYKSSALGTFVESSSYFFGDSFSTLLFDSTFYITTDTQRIPLRKELITFIHAANALEGNVNYKELPQDDLSDALDELKDSQLLPELFPVAIEFAYEIDEVKAMLAAAKQEALFLQLRYVNWDKDVENLLDVIKVAYSLDLFSEEFNPLTLDVETVRTIVELLSSTEFLPQALPIGVNVVLKLEAVQALIQDSKFKPDLSTIDWAHDLNQFVNVYEDFQELGITSFDGLDLNAILELVFESENDKNVQAVKDILSELVHLDLFKALVLPVAEKVVDAKIAELNEGKFASLVGVLPINKLSASQWESDLHALVEIADDFYELGVFTFKVEEMDLESEKAIEAFKAAIDSIFGTFGDENSNAQYGLNFIREGDTLLKIVEWAMKNFDLVAPEAELSLNSTEVNLINEGAVLKQLIDVYAELAKYDEFDIASGKMDFAVLLQKEDMGDIVVSALEALVESDILLNVLVPVIEHKALPLLDEQDDVQDIVSDMINSNTPDLIIEELTLLVEAVFSAKDLGLLRVPQDGLKAINFAETDDMKTIVNAVLGSKLFDGYEARLVAVLFKFVGLEVTADDFQGIEYARERELILNVIDALKPLFEHEAFNLFDEEGNIVLSPELKSYLLTKDSVNTMINALQVLFGDYEVEGSRGSAILEVILIPAYNKFVVGKVPAEYQELLAVINLESFTNDEIVSDVKTLVYIVDELVEFGIFGILDNRTSRIEFASNFALTTGENVIRTLGELNVVRMRTKDVLAYGVNFLVSKYNEKALAEGKDELHIIATAVDFDEVNLDHEVDALVKAYQAAIILLNENNLKEVFDIQRFVEEKQYLSADFLTPENGQLALDIVEPLLNLQVIPALVHVIEEQAYRTLSLKGYNLDGILSLRSDEITHDLQTVLSVVRKVVDLGALEYLYAKDITALDFDAVAGLLYDENGADLSDLAILRKQYGKIVAEAVRIALQKSTLKQDFTLSQNDLRKADIKVDAKELANIVTILGEVVNDLGLESLNEIIDFAKTFNAKEQLSNRNLISATNTLRVFDILGSVSKMTVVEGAAPVLFDGAMKQLSAKEPALKGFRGSVTGAELCADLASIGSLGDELNALFAYELVLGGEIRYGLDEAALQEVLETVFSLNVINNNNLEVVELAVSYISKSVKVEGLEFVVEKHLFADFDTEWKEDQEALAKAIVEIASIAYNDLGITGVQAAKDFIAQGEFKTVEFYTEDLITKLGNVVADLISLHTVGALLPSVLDYAVDLARNTEVKGQPLGLDILYILEAYENGDFTNEMLAEDVITLVQMAVMALNADVLTLVKDINNAELQLSEYAPIVEKLGELNILNYNSAKLTTQLVNLVAKLAGLEYEANNKLFVAITEEEWLEDSANLAEVLVKAQALLDELDVHTVNEIKAFINNDAKNVQDYLNEDLVDAAVELLQTVFAFHAGQELVGEIIDSLLPKLEAKLQASQAFARVELDFLAGTISQASLHEDVATLGAIAKEAIAFGLNEYLETKDIKNLTLVPVANIVALLGELNLYTNVREDLYVTAAIVASDATRKNFLLSYEDLAGIDFEEDNAQLQEVILKVDQLLKDNEHDTLSELINFFGQIGASYEQWATLENGKAVVDILDSLADVDVLMAAAASAYEYGIYFALTKDIDIRFLYDHSYKGADLSADIKHIAAILDEALEFGLIEFVWKYPVEKIELAHIQNIVRHLDQLHLFGLDKAEWTSFVVNFACEKAQINISATPELFAHVDWDAETEAVVELIGKAAELLDANHFESTTELSKFVSEKAYLSNQYVTEQNVEIIAQVLDTLAKLEVLEQLLPGLVELGMDKLGTGVEGDFTAITSKEFETLAYIVREIAAFGAVEMYNNILWGEKYFHEGEFDLTHIVNVIEALEELEILAVDKAHLAEFIINKAGFAVTYEELSHIDFSKENARLVSLVESIDALLKANYLTNLEFIYKWIENKGYESAQYINDENVLAIADLLEQVTKFELVSMFAGQLVDTAFLTNAQTHFLVGQLDNEQVVEDLVSIANIVRELVEFEAIDLYYYGTTEEFKFDALRNAIELALNLNVLNVKRNETMALVLNMALASVNAQYEASDFEAIDWELENETILAIYDEIVVLLREMNVENTAMLKAYIDQKLYMLAHYTNETTIGYAVEILDLVASLQELEVVIDELAAFGLGKVADLAFVVDAIENGEITDAELVADVHKLADIARDFLDYELYNMLYSNEYKAVDTDKFVEIFVQLDELHLLNELRPEWSVLAVNKLMGSKGSISEADLAHITDAMWADEINVLAETIVALYDYLVVRGYADNGEINRLYNEIVKEKQYKDTNYLIDTLICDAAGNKDETSVDALLAVVVKAADSDVAGIVLHNMLGVALEALDKSGIDLTKLSEIVSIAELQQDVELVAEAVKELVMFGAVEMALELTANKTNAKAKKAESVSINYSEIERVQKAVDALVHTNLLNKDSGYVMGGILKDEASRRTGYFAQEVYLSERSEALQTIIEEVAYIAMVQRIETVEDVMSLVKNPKEFKLRVNGSLDQSLLALENILRTISSDLFLSEAVLSGSKGYLAKALDKYAGIADIYGIYVGETFAEDLESIANAIEAVCQLDVYQIVSSKQPIPYGEVGVLETVLNEILGLNYFNAQGRTEELIDGIGSLIKVDLSGFAQMDLDLEGDASQLVEMYKELLVILEHPEFPFLYVNDFKTKKLETSFVLSKPILEAAYAAYQELRLTSIYEETDGAILVVLLPLVKVALPEYYNATNIANCSKEQLFEDAKAIIEAISVVLDSDIIDGLKDTSASINMTEAVDVVETVINTVLDLNMLAGDSLMAVVNLVLRDAVYGKTIAGITISAESFDLSTIDPRVDAEALINILREVVVVLDNEGIDSLSGIKSLMNMESIKAIILDETNLDAIANAMEHVSTMTFFLANADTLWEEYVLPRLAGTRLERFAKYEGATNEQFAEELALGAQIVRVLNDLGIVEVYNGAAINYDQAAEVEELLALVAQLNYFELNHETIYNFIATRVEARGGIMFEISEFTLSQDIEALGKVYGELVPILTDAEFPYTTLAQYLEMLETRTIPSKKVVARIAYENKDALLDAYHVARENGLGKYALVLALPALKVIAPEYYEVLDLSSYTFEDLKADANVAVEIAKRAKDSQALEVLKDRGAAVIDFNKAAADFEYIMNKALELRIIENGNLGRVINKTLEKYIYGKSVAGVYAYDLGLDFTNVDFQADAAYLAQIVYEGAEILNNSGITTLGQLKAKANKAGVKEILVNEANIEAIANIMEAASQMTVVEENANNVWNNFVMPNLEASRFAEYARFVNYEGATNEQFAEELALGAQIVRAINGLGIVEVYNGAAIDYDQAAEVEALFALIAQLNYFELNQERIYDFIAVRVEARGGIMFDYADFTLAQDIEAAGKVYGELLPILLDARFPYTTLDQYLDMLRTRNIPSKRLVAEIAYDHRDAVLDAYHVARENGLGKYALVLALPALKVVLPDFYAALDLTGYTYEDLKADANVAVEIAKRAKDSQALEVLRNRYSAVIDFNRAAADFEFMMNKALEMKIFENGNLGRLIETTLVKFIYGKSFAGVYVNDFGLDLTNVDFDADAALLAQIVYEGAEILNNSGITTLGQLKAKANKAGVKEIVANVANLEAIANIMELAAQMTVVEENATNVWHLFVLPKLEGRGLDKLVSYEGATSAELVHDLALGAQIVRVINGLGVVDAYHGADINYDQAAEVAQLLTLLSQLNYFEIDKETIFNLLSSKVSAFEHFGATAADLDLQGDLIKLISVYNAALPILTNPEYPYTKLAQYLDMLRTRNFPGKGAVANIIFDDMQLAVDVYSAAKELDMAKYAYVFAYNKVKSMGIASSLVALADPSALSAAEVEAELDTFEALANLVVASGVKFGIKNGKPSILGSSVIDFAVVSDIVNELYNLKSLEGDFDAIVDIASNKVGITLPGAYDGIESKATLLVSIDALADIFDELGATNVSEMLNLYKDLENTALTVLEDSDIHAIIVAYIDEAVDTEFGRDVVRNLFEQKVLSVLPAEYQDIINFADPTYVPALWANDMNNLFVIYNELEALNYGDSSFAPTVEQAIDLFDMLFITNTPHSVAQNKQVWLERVIFDNLPTLGKYAPDYANVADWDQEVVKVRAVLEAIETLVGPTSEIVGLDMADFYQVDSYDNITNLLTALSESITMRSLIIAIMDEGINASSSNSAKITVSDLLSVQFLAQIDVDGYTYNEAHWTAAELASIARILLVSNEVLRDALGNVDPSALDFTNPAKLGMFHESAFDANNNVDSTKVGLGHLLVLFYESNTFTLESLDGNDGLIADEMSAFISDTSLIGEFDETQDIIDVLDVIVAVDAATAGQLNANGIETIYSNISSQEVEDMIDSIKASEVLQGMLPFLMRDIIVEAASQKSIAPSLAFNLIKLVDNDLGTALETPNASNASYFYTIPTADLIAAVEIIKSL